MTFVFKVKCNTYCKYDTYLDVYWMYYFVV